jgi:polyisoprenoid-binding protein YceI
MKKSTMVLIVIGAGSVILAGVSLYLVRPPAAPSQDITSVPPALPSSPAPSISNVATYRIIPEQSRIEFSIDEILYGNPFTVVGATDQVAGEFQMGDAVAFGEIAVNARTFKTDSTKRDGAIARLILKAESPGNEFIIFMPRNVSGTQDSLTVEGDLTIAGVTKPASFAVALQTQGEGVVAGTAKATLSRSDFNLVIPNLSFVAGVPDTFQVTAAITAELVAAP